MKKLLLLLIILSFAELTNCKKCKICTTEMTGTGMPTTITNWEACGDDLRAVDGKTVTSTTSGITVTRRTTCKSHYHLL